LRKGRTRDLPRRRRAQNARNRRLPRPRSSAEKPRDPVSVNVRKGYLFHSKEPIHAA
jgi:hypothetical protein